MLENRLVTKRVFADLFRDASIQPVDGYVSRLSDLLHELSSHRLDGSSPLVVVLTPGVYNAAYFEHSYLAQAMGVPLVEGPDLFVDDDDVVYLHTIDRPLRVDVVYRRVDDDLFLDPEVYRPRLRRRRARPHASVAGRQRRHRQRLPGAGVADDKVIYTFVPEMIRFYLAEEPILASVPTFWCGDPEDRAHVLDHLAELVVKPATEAGGHGIVVGPQASADQLRPAAGPSSPTPPGSWPSPWCRCRRYRRCAVTRSSLATSTSVPSCCLVRRPT